MRLILADSNELIRIGLRAIIGSKTDWEVIGEARNNKELQEIILNFGEAIVLIDFSAPGFDIGIVPKVLNANKKVKFVESLNI